MPKYKEASLLNIVLFSVCVIAIPFVLIILFGKWSDSVSRQIVGAGGLLTMFALAMVKQKQNLLALLIIFTTQLSVSLVSFNLNAPVTLPILFFDIILILIILNFIEIREKIKLTKFAGIILVLIFWQIISTYYSAHQNKSLVFVLWSVKYLLLYIVLSNIDFKNEFYRKLPIVIAAIVVVQGLVVIAQYITGGYLGLAVMGERDPTRSAQFFVNEYLRGSGTLGASNAFGGYIAMLLVFLLPYVIRKNSIFYFAVYLIGLIALYIPLSRAAWLSYLIGSAILGAQMLRYKLIKRERIFFMSGIALALIIAVVFVNKDQISYRFQDKAAMASAEGRLSQIPHAWSTTLKHPVLGIGPGVSSFFGAWNDHAKYIKRSLPDINLQNQYHNSILQYLVESGIPGGAIFLMLISYVIVSVFKKYDRFDQYAILKLACSAAALTYLIDTQFGTEINNFQMMTLFICMMSLFENKYLNTKKT